MEINTVWQDALQGNKAVKLSVPKEIQNMSDSILEKSYSQPIYNNVKTLNHSITFCPQL